MDTNVRSTSRPLIFPTEGKEPKSIRNHHRNRDYFFALFAFFAGAFSLVSSSGGAPRFVPMRELFLVPSVGAFFSFLGALALPSPFFPVAFLPLLAFGLSDFSFLASSFSSGSTVFTSSSFLSSDFCSGAPFSGSFLDPGSFS